ncbi:hypothetical protein HZS_354 [Henneguya salminicola]|nr:hypothetical protein HZS_354 [Henneguya salminicola]
MLQNFVKDHSMLAHFLIRMTELTKGMICFLYWGSQIYTPSTLDCLTLGYLYKSPILLVQYIHKFKRFLIFQIMDFLRMDVF